MSADTYRVNSRNPVNLADGRMVGPGEDVKKLDLKDSHNQRLIDRGALVRIEKPQQNKSKVEAKAPQGDNKGESE